MSSSEDDEPTANKRYLRRRSKTTSKTPPSPVIVTTKKRSKSSPTLNINLCTTRPPAYSPLTPLSPILPISMPHIHDPDDDDDDVLWHAKRSNSTGSFNIRNPSPPEYTASNSSLRARIFSFAAGKTTTTKERERLICTKPGEKGAGETETEVDEPPKHLPTARSTTSLSLPSSTSHQKRPLHFLFQCFRLLAVVPAFIGVLWCILCIIHYSPSSSEPDRADYTISILWALLTGYQCHSLTSGLLTRWQVYYPPLPTLIRLLGLQAICWPATQITMNVVDVYKRPVMAWAVVGTCTCCSRAVQIWVTSNLWWDQSQSQSDRSGSGEDGGKGGGRWRGGMGWKKMGLESSRLEVYLPRWSGLLCYGLGWGG